MSMSATARGEHGFVTAPEVTLQDSELRLFQDLMYREAGIRLADAKHSLVQSRLRKRLDALELESFRDYHCYVTTPGHEAEFQKCLEALTTNETYFFRHKQHWDFLLGDIVPGWKKSASKGSTFRAWSAASSSGEEAYSLAIALTEAFARSGHAAKIDATDINTQVIARAKAGIYAAYALQKLTPHCLQRYLTPQSGGQRHQVNADIRKLVEFRPHNLQQPSQGPAYDLILLRNVLIYFDGDSKGVVLAHISARLKSGGWLILGGSETLSERNDEFTYVRPTIYRKR